MNPTRAAIVGCGRISDIIELGYGGRDDAQIVAVCDTKRGRARSKAWGVEKIYTDYYESDFSPPLVRKPYRKTRSVTPLKFDSTLELIHQPVHQFKAQ